MNVCIDTDGDGVFDKILFNTDLGSFTGTGGAQDTFFSAVFDIATGFATAENPVNLFDSSAFDTGALSNNTMMLIAFGPDLALASGVTKIKYGVAVCPGNNSICGAADWDFTNGVGTANCGTPTSAFASFNGPITYDAATPGVDGNFNILDEDLNGGTVAVPYDVNTLVANGSSGMLLLHSHIPHPFFVCNSPSPTTANCNIQLPSCR